LRRKIVPTFRDCGEKYIIINGTFTSSEIDSQSAAVYSIGRFVCLDINRRLPARLCRRTDDKAGTSVAVLVQLRIFCVFRVVVVFDFRIESRGKRRSVENCGFCHSAFTR